MSYIIKKIGETYNTPTYFFECDNTSDIKQISKNMVPMGSRCRVINEAKEYVLDSEGQWRSAKNGEILVLPDEEILEGDGAEFYTLAPTPLTFRSTAPLDELKEVQINGVTVDPSNYTLEEGSTIVTLPIEYLKTLDVDNYEITVVSDSKSAKGGFTVAAPDLNEYGFYYSQPYSAYVECSMSLGGVPMSYSDTYAFWLYEDGSATVRRLGNNTLVSTTYSISDNVCTILGSGISAPTLVGTFHENGSFVCTEFRFSGPTNVTTPISFSAENGAICVAGDWEYAYNNSLNGYSARPIDNAKSSYGPIMTGIYGKPTVAIAATAFENNSSLETITIPTFVKSIGLNAFKNCIALRSVSFEEGIQLETIGEFMGCDVLAEIKIPASVIKIAENAFADCENLNSIVFEGTVEQWKAITFGRYWNRDVPAAHVQCSDGQVAL